VKVLVVVNPIAGAGRAREGGSAVARALERRGHGVEYLETRGPDDARRATREREAELDTLVVAGGDGTLNEVVNGLADPRALPVAHLACGTGNMLARELGVPRDPERLAALVEAGRVRRIDLARTRERRFLAVAGVGFDGMVARAVARRRHGTMGYLGYAVPLWQTLRGYRAPRLSVRFDGGEPVEGALVIASHLRNYGGILRVTPGARCDSGLLDVCVFRGRRTLDLVRYAAAAGAGGLGRLRDVETRRARHFAIEAEEPVPVQLDGDWRGTTPVEIEVEPGVVPFVCPEPRQAP
jgi:diacylglycerol kinase (ATP)